MDDKAASKAQRIINEELERLGGWQRRSDTDVFIICPFHDDSQPSCGICVVHGTGIPLGYGYCFGCGVKGGWNRFADKLGLRKIAEGDAILSQAVAHEESLARRRSAVGMSGPEVSMPAGVPYPYSSWRGISGKVVRAAGGVMAVRSSGRGDEVKLYFPAERDVNGRYRETVGVVQADMEKSKGASYILLGGSHVKDDGLFPLELAERSVATGRFKALVLVEGPRDALRLMGAGVPALSILSTTQWSEKKAQSVAWLCRRNKVLPVVMMDGDSAGEKARVKMMGDLSGYRFGGRPPAYIDMLRKAEELGKPDLDPANAPRSFVRELKRRVASRP